jgi:hypothetical protein
VRGLAGQVQIRLRRRPVVQQHAIGLQRIADPRARGGMLLLHRLHLLEERQPGQGWLAALPGYVGHPRVGHVGRVLGDELLQHAIVDAAADAGALQRLAVVAVAAVQVAVR